MVVAANPVQAVPAESGSIGPFDVGEVADINAASKHHGVPAPVIMAIITRESSGDWDANNRWVRIDRGAGGIVPYVGIFDNAWQSFGCPGHNYEHKNDRAAQVDCLARGLRKFYDRPDASDWNDVAAIHFSGKPYPNDYCDENGMCTNVYVPKFAAAVKRYGGSINDRASGKTDAQGGGASLDFSWIIDSFQSFAISSGVYIVAIVFIGVGLMLWLH